MECKRCIWRSIRAGGRESQSQQRLLLEFVRFGRTGGGAGARRSLHRAHLKSLGLRQAFEPRQHVEERSHIGRLFLDPYNFSSIGMLGQRGGDFRPREWVKLVEEKDG